MEGIYKILVPLLFILLPLLSQVSSENACPNGHMKCKTSEKCVPLSWKCDGDADCEDKSDEQDCPAKTCAKTEFNCHVNGSCIPQRWQCDGEPDCDNGEDESETNCVNKEACKNDEFYCGDKEPCINQNWVCDGVADCENGNDEKNCSTTCEGSMFTCADGQCISNSWECDGDADCEDGSDETNCGEKICSEGEFRCLDSTRCIDIKWRCDGDFDCADHSDESANCTGPNGDDDFHTEFCSETEFKCKESGECIHDSWKCDGDEDCTDGSDEGSECNYSCKDDQFMCDNHVCISNFLRCDHNSDCSDSSDEKNCSYHHDCAAQGMFDCYGDGTECISMNLVCDGHSDCVHREDEDADMCKLKDPCVNHVCHEHSHCVKQTVAHNRLEAKCECSPGFEMVEDHCKDIDECKDPGLCSQICTNTKGGYKCDCLEGYTLEKHHFCRADGNIPWLYYANRRDIRRLRSDTSFMEIVVEQTKNSVGIALDIKEGLIFWTDGGDMSIKRANIGEELDSVAQAETVVVGHETKDDFSSDGIAVDWLYQNIYWTENSQNKIMVANYDGSMKSTLVTENLDDPRAIVVDPENGYVYWTDWGKHAKIERASMDGSNRQVLLEGDSLGWPNGLAIDYISKRLFWIDAKLHKIGSMNYDGSDFKYVYEDASDIQRPFAIDVFEDSLYWTDWFTNSIKTVHKMTGLSAKTLNIGSYSIMDIKVYHDMKQSHANKTKAQQLCAAKQCEYMCVPTATINSTMKVACVCGDGMELKGDKKSCKQSAVTPAPPTTKKPAKTTSKPGKVTTEKPGKPSAVTTDKPGYTVIGGQTTQETGTKGSAGKKEDQNVGGIALITACVVAAILIVVFVTGCIVYRKFQNRNKKSMNFDNPVYRKTTTTDERCIINNDEPQMEPFVRRGSDEEV